MTDDEGSADDPGRSDVPGDDGDSSADTDAADAGERRDEARGTTTPRTDDTPSGTAHEARASSPADSEDDQRDISAGVTESGPNGDRRPRPEPGSAAAGSQSFLTRFRTAQSGPLMFVRETIYSAAAVLGVGLLLFAISGVWPPMVAVESGSMEPEMHRGDLVFVTEPHRFTPDYAYDDTGIVTVDIGTERGYRSFGGNGSVVIYDPPDRVGSPIIHRAHFYVEEGENWYDEANPAYVTADDCDALQNCPAPHAGFITKGDANSRYDQASNIAGPVRPTWIRGTARLRIPYLGYVRLQLAGMFAA
mgnify:FL=1